MLLLDRLFYPEKWLYIRLRLANVDPRIGGLGNMVNCGAAMYAAPVGIVNACDPQAAYREAIEIFSAHQHSFGLEAAGVMAACVAEAFRPGASVDSIVDVALSLAQEGTRAAIAAAVDCARTQNDWRAAIEPLRAAIQPYDGAAEDFHNRGNGSNDWNPSRMHSIEEVPIALGFLVTTGGGFEIASSAAQTTHATATHRQYGWGYRRRAARRYSHPTNGSIGCNRPIVSTSPPSPSRWPIRGFAPPKTDGAPSS